MSLQNEKETTKDMEVNDGIYNEHHHHHEHHHHEHHHHHSHSREDDASKFKRASLKVRRRRKIISNVLFVFLSIVAFLVVVACVLSNYLM